jgi:DNA invertase Pin-like site-specific DNA recombinase
MTEIGITWGYARISSVTQHEDRQIKKLLEFGVDERHILVDKESGGTLNRDEYQLLKTKLLRAGDNLVIEELDRLARKKIDIKRELEEFKAMGVRVKILDIPTTLVDFKEELQWIQEMITNILIEVLGGFAEEERRKILKRQREGIDVALEKGVKFGRPQVQVPEEWERVVAMVENKEITSVEAMSLLNLKKTTYYKLRKMMSYGGG